MTTRVVITLLAGLWAVPAAGASDVPLVADIEGQPLAAQVGRVVQALEFLGHPLPPATRQALAAAQQDPVLLQQALDPQVLVVVHINPELRVKLARGPAAAGIVQGGHTPCLVKVLNEGAVTERLRIGSPQAGAVYAGAALGSLQRQEQTELAANPNLQGSRDRFLDVQMWTSPPLTPRLSGFPVEYAVALIYARDAGAREATLTLDVGQGTQDLGFRSELPILWQIRPARPVRLRIRDGDGTRTVARLTIRDPQARVYPPQAKRLAPDFFFQPQVYRRDGDVLHLPPGTYTVTSCRGPEYRELQTTFVVPATGPEVEWVIPLQRWVQPLDFGFVCGDHHIHGAGCAHYEVPTQGVTPDDMFRQVQGEGLHVGCVLTWGPCYDFQRQYFAPVADRISEPLTILKYDVEVSGFGSQALGHVCLLNLRDQTYPGSEGTKIKGWPTWTLPVLQWAKAQGGVTGYPHSDMRVDIPGYAQRLMRRLDRDGDGWLTAAEASPGLLAEPVDRIDADRNERITVAELAASADRASQELPHLVLPAMLGSGAMEIFVSVPAGVCDFISAMDTGRIGEWNTWYHLLNCGFPLKVSGETDFPCMSSVRVGQGRVYVRLAEGPLDRVDFAEWCRGLAAGRSYVSDGYAHALAFTVNGRAPGTDDVQLPAAGTVHVRAQVAFAAEVPSAVAHGSVAPPEGRREVGDTRILHVPRSNALVQGGTRLVELVVNGRVAARRELSADGKIHTLDFNVPIERSSWVALRQFPQLHTNPVQVLVGGAPIRASRASARWCAESVELLWENRSRLIGESERPAARAAYDRALEIYRARAAEADPGT